MRLHIYFVTALITAFASCTPKPDSTRVRATVAEPEEKPAPEPHEPGKILNGYMVIYERSIESTLSAPVSGHIAGPTAGARTASANRTASATRTVCKRIVFDATGNWTFSVPVDDALFCKTTAQGTNSKAIFHASVSQDQKITSQNCYLKSSPNTKPQLADKAFCGF